MEQPCLQNKSRYIIIMTIYKVNIITNNYFFIVFNCSQLEIQRPTGGLTVSYSSANITYGTQALYHCSDAQYNLVGAHVRVCGQDGAWSGEEPHCEC